MYKPFSQRITCNSKSSEPDKSCKFLLSWVRGSCVDTNTGLRSEQKEPSCYFYCIKIKRHQTLLGNNISPDPFSYER